jgi:squalene-hopene cyclase-like protein/prenyltransferase/squalene oxidase-like repeat protein
MGLGAFVAAATLAVSPQQFLLAHQGADGAFAEKGGRPSVTLTAWAVLGLRAAHTPADDRYLRAHEDQLTTPTEIALGVLAEGRPSNALRARLEAVQPGTSLNVAAWQLLALAQAGRPLPATSVRFLLAHQSRSGGWSWGVAVAPDSNDTAAVVQALRAAHVGGRPITRALAYLRRLQNKDGGFALVPKRASDAQSTAWAIQAFIAAGKGPGRRAYHYLAHLRRADGSYRYSSRYAITPVWVTAQVLPALAGRPFPLR